MKVGIVALLAGALWACNNQAAPDETDQDATRMSDSGSTPGGNTAVNDTLTRNSRAGVDSAQLDALDTPKTQ